jgi:nucleoid DNA-binding protein
MVDMIIKLLQDGDRVVLGELGTFYVSLRSDPAEFIEDFSVHRIKGNKVNYLASMAIKRALRNVSYSTSKMIK